MSRSERAGFRTFVVMWATQSLSLIGSAVTLFTCNVWLAAAVYPHDPTALAEGLALNNGVFFAGNLLMAPVAGVYADRHDRQRVMAIANLLSGAATFLLGALTLGAHAGLGCMVVTTAIVSAADAFHSAAFDASYGGLVVARDLARANGMLQTSWSLRRMVGPTLATLVFGLPALLARHDWHLLGVERLANGAAFGFFFDSGTFIVAGVTLALLRLPKHVPTKGPKASILRELPFAWIYIHRRRGLLWLLSLFFVNNLADGITMVLGIIVFRVDIASDWAARGMVFEDALALWVSVTAAGGVIGGIVMTAWGGLQRRRALGVITSMILVGAALVSFLTRSLLPILAASFLKGLASPAMNAHSQSIWQLRVPSEMQGRVFSTRRLIAQCSLPLGSLVAGMLGGRMSASGTIAVVGAVLLTASVAQLFNRTLLDVDSASSIERDRMASAAAPPREEGTRAHAR